MRSKAVVKIFHSGLLVSLFVVLGFCNSLAEAGGPTSPVGNGRNTDSERFHHPKIVIDPGHGGTSIGAVGPDNLVEKQIVLDVAKLLTPLLQKRLGATVVMTRESDTFVSLEERTAMANNVGADLFVSLHVNATPKKNQSGLEVFYLDNSDDKASIKLAERENTSGFKDSREKDLEFMLSDLVQSSKLSESIVLAHTIEREVYGHLHDKWAHVKTSGVKKAPFYVLVGAHMPCVLVELFFLDSGNDAPMLRTSAFRSDIAEGLYRGIRKYLEISGYPSLTH